MPTAQVVITAAGNQYDAFASEKPANLASDVVREGWDMVQAHVNDAYGTTIGMIDRMHKELSTLMGELPALNADYVAPRMERTVPNATRPPVPTLTPLTGAPPAVETLGTREAATDMTDYADAARAAELFPRVAEVLGTWLTGAETGLPADIEDAVWQRDRERTVATAQAQVEREQRQWAARGWNMPSGTQARRVRVVQDDAARTIIAQSRDVAIRQHQAMLEARRFAVQQAYQMSKDLLQLRFQVAIDLMRLALDSFDAVTRRYVGETQAKVSLYQGQAQVETEFARMYSVYAQTDAQVFDSHVRQAIAQVEAKVKSGQLRVDTIAKKIDAALGYWGASTHVGTAVTSAAWSAVNVAAGVHGSGSESDSTSRSISFSHSFPHKES